MEKYTKQWSSSNNGGKDCGILVFLVDKSGSMNELLENGQTRSEMVASVINRTIETMIRVNQQDGTIRDRIRIVVISYSNEVKIEAVGTLSELYQNPLEVKEVEQKVPDGNVGLTTIKLKQRIWTKPIGKDEQGCTCMAEAFAVATRVLKEVAQPSNPAPIVINISDGWPQFPIEGIDYTEENIVEVFSSSIDLTRRCAKDLTAIETDDGNVLLYNAYIGEGEKILYPNDEKALGSEDIGKGFLFDISSKIPEPHLRRSTGVKDAAKGLVINPDEVSFIDFIDFGSRGGEGALEIKNK